MNINSESIAIYSRRFCQEKYKKNQKTTLSIHQLDKICYRK